MCERIMHVEHKRFPPHLTVFDEKIVRKEGVDEMGKSLRKVFDFLGCADWNDRISAEELNDLCCFLGPIDKHNRVKPPSPHRMRKFDCFSI